MGTRGHQHDGELAGEGSTFGERRSVGAFSVISKFSDVAEEQPVWASSETAMMLVLEEAQNNSLAKQRYIQFLLFVITPACVKKWQERGHASKQRAHLGLVINESSLTLTRSSCSS